MNAKRGSVLIIAVLIVLVGGCNLTSPSDSNFSFLDSFSMGLIVQGPGVSYDFLSAYPKGFLIPSTSAAGTPNGKPVFTASDWQIGGEKRNALVAVAPSRIIYDLPFVRKGAHLVFGAGASFARGDGVLGLVLVHVGGDWDTVYSQYIDPASHPEQWHWFNEDVDLSRYVGKVISVAFVADPGPAGDTTGDWFAWSSPLLRFPLSDGTSTDSGVLLVHSYDVGGEKRDAILTLEGSQITFDLPANRDGDLLCFGVGMDSVAGNGAVVAVLVDYEGVTEAVYKRVLDPAHRVEDRHWFDEAVELERYHTRPISVTFTASAVSTKDTTLGWIAWSTPVLTYLKQH